MNTSMTRLLQAGLLVVGSVWWVGRADATKNPDTIVLNVAPDNAQQSVSISSVGYTTGYDFGSLDLAATTESTAAIKVTNDGTVSEYFAMKVDNSNGGWAAVATGTPGLDQFKLTGIFKASQPATTDYTVSGTTITASGFPSVAAWNYGQNNTRTAPTSFKNLWLQLTMPNDVTTGNNAQTIRLYVNAQGQ
jgi:hypothetical protein